MKTIEMNKFVISCLLAIMSLPISAQTHDDEVTSQLPQKVDYTYLSDNFKSPGSLYGTDCWWWWLNGHVSKEAITKELEAMKARHFYGAMVFDAGGQNQRGNKDIPAGPQFGSKEWNDLFVFALDEAKRLGLGDWLQHYERMEFGRSLHHSRICRKATRIYRDAGERKEKTESAS
jgi:hypothetical protein